MQLIVIETEDFVTLHLSWVWLQWYSVARAVSIPAVAMNNNARTITLFILPPPS
jgi:hypothetical protein